MNRFGRYILERELKGGGMGRVYLATDTRTGRRVVLKIIKPGSSDEARAERKAAEYGAKLQKALAKEDPNVPKVLEFGTQNREFFIAMEYVPGEDLSSIMSRQRLPYDAVFRIAAAVCMTLRRAHNLTTNIDGNKIDRIFHGDIKPQNIRLTPDGQVKLLDFGIAKGTSLTRNLTYSDFGTLEYCSPERIANDDMDVNSDLWALGVTLYEMVAGRRPFRADRRRELVERFNSRLAPDPLPADCPPLLKGLIERALSFDLHTRFASAAEMGKLLEAASQPPTGYHSAGSAQTNSAPATAGTWVGIDVRDGGVTQTVYGDGGRVPLRRGVLFGLAAVLAVLILVSAHEFKAWQGKEQLTADLRGAQVLHQADLDPLWQRYKNEADSGFLKVGLSSLGGEMQQKLYAVPRRVAEEYAKEQPEVPRSNWVEAQTCLARIVEINSGDPLAAAMLHYCEGQLERLEGDRLRDEGAQLRAEGAQLRSEGKRAEGARKQQEAGRKQQEAGGHYQAAVRHFRDAIALQPQWPHPHLGLAVVYTYGDFDTDRAEKALGAAKALGLNLGRRETALNADRLFRHGNDLCAKAEGNKGSRARDYKQALAVYEQALEMFNQIPDFTKYTRGNIKQVEEKIKQVENKIRELEGAGGGHAEEARKP